jgi:membrane protein YdbS with pleckstrin-like domain
MLLYSEVIGIIFIIFVLAVSLLIWASENMARKLIKRLSAKQRTADDSFCCLNMRERIFPMVRIQKQDFAGAGLFPQSQIHAARLILTLVWIISIS